MVFCAMKRHVAAVVATIVLGAMAPQGVAADFMVNTIGDNGVGSLRQAIVSANQSPGPDRIVFALGSVVNPPVFLNLDSPLPIIVDDVQIIGPGSNVIITQRNPIGNPGNFGILAASGQISVEIRGLAITSGSNASGAAISATGGTLTVRECLIYENRSTGVGGAIAVVGAGDCTVNIIDSQLFSNSASTMGGGVFVQRSSGRATVRLDGAFISRNTLGGLTLGNLGGGLYVAGAGPHDVTIERSTLSENAISTDGQGAGLFIDGGGGSVSIINSTIAGNTSGLGSGIAFANATLSINGATITGNSTFADAAGGTILDVSSAGFTVRNTILSGNIAAGQFRDLSASQQATGNNNLIGVGGPFVNGVSGNIVGVTNPRLVPLNDNGGPTQTFALQPDSPALDAGSPANAPAQDQRRQNRPSDADNNGVALPDIGAFETQRYLVTTVTSEGTGSLRQAVIDNNLAGGGFVKFAIGAQGSQQSIALSTALPVISRTIFIDAWSQGGNAYQGPPLVEIDGVSLPDAIGLDIQWSDCVIRGLAVNRFTGSVANGVGIKLSGRAALRNWIYGNNVGVGLDGTTNRGNGQLGIWIAPAANVNLIGTNADGINDANERNVIGGISGTGLRTGVFIQSNSNVVAGNVIGLNASGSAAIPNFNGVWIENGTSNRIGSSAFSASPASERNIISGNTNVGVSLTSTGSNNTISGNFIGVNQGGTAALPNLIGVLLDNVNQTLVGGTFTGAGNVVSGNTQHGVLISGSGATGNLLQGNIVGLSASGAQAIPNGMHGLVIRNGASGNRIGAFGDNNATLEPLRRNVFSGNNGRGIVIRDSSSQLNRVLGNFIGTDTSGLVAIGNAMAGVQISSSATNTIGSSGSGRNVISGQSSATSGFGVEITGADASGNIVRNNLIGLGADGTTRVPNAAGGVSISGGASFNQIGGTGDNQGNTIHVSGADGVRVVDAPSLANSILRNSIFDSAGLGIDLADDGVTPNGPAGSVRNGPNTLQNYPVISDVSTSGVVTMSLESEGNQTFRIEVFSSPTVDPTGFGEGLRFLGARTVATDSTGRTGVFTQSVALQPGERFITATATKLAPGSEAGFPTPPGTPLGTSEFSLARAVNTEPTADNVVASGPEDSLIVVQLLAGDPDPGNTLSFRVTTLPTRGTLLQFGTLDPIATANTSVTDAQGRVVFRPNANEFGSAYASFGYVANDGALDSAVATATVNVTPVADTPGVTNASTREDQQTTSGLVITRNIADGPEVTHFKITAITNGTLFQNDGVTPIASGAFISVAQGNAGLRFTPAPNSIATGSFDVQASLAAADAGLGGGVVTAVITVTAVADEPRITGASTREDTPTASGLEIRRSVADGPEVTHFKIESLSVQGALTLAGGTPVAIGSFITVAQGELGLRYAPPQDFFGPVTVTVRASTSATDEGLGASSVATITVTPVNDRPDLSAASPSAVLEDSGPQVLSAWATFSPGPPNESDQTVLEYSVSDVTNAALFAAAPTVDATGTLRFTPAADAFGTSQFTVRVRDTGGTVDGGVDTSAPRTFTITVDPVNDRPSLTAFDPPAVLEDSGPQVVSGWATFVAGPANESDQTIAEYIVSNVGQASLFSQPPTVDSSGTLRYTPAPDAFGTSQFTVAVRDSGGTANGGVDTSSPRTFTITVGPVNDRPSFAAGNPNAVLEDSGSATITNWATFVPGPANESDQTVLNYAVSAVVNPALFSDLPTVDASGVLRFTPAPDAFGSSQFTVTVRDSGGTAGGGIDTSFAQTFTITVLPVNDAPAFSLTQPPAVLENSGTVMAPGVATSFVAGPANESGQQPLEYIVDQVSNPGLFETPPAIDTAGLLTYTVPMDVYGSSTARVRVRDNGGIANGGVDTSQGRTITIIVRPRAVCRDLFIDARRVCVPLIATPSQLNATPIDPTPGGMASVEFSRPLNQPFPFGNTQVQVTVRYADGLVTSCTSIVTVLATDCNNNGIPDSCETAGGTLVDCNDDGIADDCQCLWDNGSIAASAAATANGQLSHMGGLAVMSVQTADDLYLAPNQIHRLFSFQGQMFTNSLIRKARLEFYEDCNGRPSGPPIRTYINTSVENVAPGPSGFSLLTYRFDFCNDALYLEGGRVYWVVLYGLPDGTGQDLSYWVTTTPGSNPGGVMGSAPLKRFGEATGQYLQFVYGPWGDAAECCAGCVNLSWRINGESCKILHDNGLPVTGPGATGSPSGADRANPTPPKTADDFVTPPCNPVEVCYLDAFVWTNCSPSQGYVELYASEPCGHPQTAVIRTMNVSRWVATDQQISVDGQTLTGYRIIFHNPRWLLEPGRNYWLSFGVRSGGSLVGRTLFAKAANACDDPGTCNKTSQWRNGRTFDAFAVPLEWRDNGLEHAFRVVVRDAVGAGAPPAQPGDAPPCYTDLNDDGATNAQDLFDFLNAWFTGCP